MDVLTIFTRFEDIYVGRADMYWYNFTDEEMEELEKASTQDLSTKLKCRCCLKVSEYQINESTKIENIRCKNISCYIKGCLEYEK
jgi:hypothetical protein